MDYIENAKHIARLVAARKPTAAANHLEYLVNSETERKVKAMNDEDFREMTKGAK